jgi:transposase
LDALPDQPHLGQSPAITPQIEEAIRLELRKDERTWTAAQLAEWIGERFGVLRTAAHLARRLDRAGIAYRRTGRSLKHKQNPDEVAAKQAEMEALEKRGDQGEIDVAHLDEAGVALTLPVTYSWYAVGEQLCLPHEAPLGQRVNAIGAYFTHGVLADRLEFETSATLPKSRAKTPLPLEQRAAKYGSDPAEVGPIGSERFLRFVWKIAGRPEVHPEEWRRERELAVWLDNYAVHKSEQVQAELPALERAGITQHYLPAYSPGRSKIEPVWHDVKNQEMSERSHDKVRAPSDSGYGTPRLRRPRLKGLFRARRRAGYSAVSSSGGGRKRTTMWSFSSPSGSMIAP